jgi:hypothetical protein
MTHFTVGIIVSQGEPDVEGFIARQMEPYYEHTEAEPYVCYSLEQAAQDIASTIHRLELIVSRKEPHYDIAKCRENLEQLRRMTPEQKYAERIRHHEHFNDRGEPISTYNPDSKWDWYVIGGRWDGWINDKETGGESVTDNTATTDQAIARDKIPHAIITPDGEWHENGQMGWWAILLTENENWDPDARAILARYTGHRLVIVDAHI